jgi:hypothetical protein
VRIKVQYLKLTGNKEERGEKRKIEEVMEFVLNSKDGNVYAKGEIFLLFPT